MEAKGIFTYDEDTCRICMSHQSGVIDINSGISSKSAKIIDMVRFCFDIEMVLHDTLPNYICNECALHLNVAYNLKGKCLETEKFFLNYMNVETIDTKNNLFSLLEPISPPASEMQDNVEQKVVPEDVLPSSNTTDNAPEAVSNDNEVNIKYIRPNLLAYFTQDTLIELSDTDSDTDDEGGAPVVSLSIKTPHECPCCSVRFDDLFRFHIHVKGHDKYVCKICSKTCVNYSNLIMHFKTHRPDAERVKCPNCDYTSILKASVIKHIRGSHSADANSSEISELTDKLIFCKLCETHFGRIEEFRMHLRSAHDTVVKNNSEARKYYRAVPNAVLQCTECSRQFKTTASYNVHMRLHDKSKLHFCYVCKLSFKNNMYLHFKVCHPGLMPYKCTDHCSATFTSQKAFMAHQKEAKRRVSGEIPPVETAKKARYSLPTSQKRASANGLPPLGYSFVPLNYVETFECYICDVKVESEVLLDEHIDNHDKKKCKKCFRIFGNSRALIGHYKLKHPRVETKDMYACEDCGKQLDTYASLKRHQYNLHKMDPEPAPAPEPEDAPEDEVVEEEEEEPETII